MVPDLDSPVWTAGDENLRVVVVPLHSIHCHGVGIIGLQELARVSLGALGNKGKVLLIICYVLHSPWCSTQWEILDELVRQSSPPLSSEHQVRGNLFRKMVYIPPAELRGSSKVHWGCSGATWCTNTLLGNSKLSWFLQPENFPIQNDH